MVNDYTEIAIIYSEIGYSWCVLDGIFGNMSSLHYSDGDRWQGCPPLNARVTHWEPAGEVPVRDAHTHTHTHTHNSGLTEESFC